MGIKLSFAPDVEVDFVDREHALEKIRSWAIEGMVKVQVVYGPEGCGKTAWLRQSVEILRGMGFDVIYINPLEKGFLAEVGVEEVRMRLLEILREATDEAWARAVWAAVDLARELIKAGRKKLAILADDVFQAIGLGKASIYVKGLLGLIEYPPRSYDRIVAVVATSEGVSRREIGRHRWGDLMPMWNMPKEGFKQLYDQLPGDKPGFEEVWRITGGNPKLLAELYKAGWNSESIVKRLAKQKEITPDFVKEYRGWLEKAVEDPDVLWSPDAPRKLIDELISRNLVIYNLYERDWEFWVDKPPPERDPQLGIGKHVAWQTPLHREAIRKALEEHI
ncbi:MAG: ATP-binding protein [Sulfolobales archaeon]